MRVEVKGKEKLNRVARVLATHAESASIRKRLTKTFRDEGLSITREQRANLAEDMPHRGGLAAELASRGKFTVRTVISTRRRAVVDIVDSWRGHDMKAVEAGLIRHPLFGNRRHWFATTVPRGRLSAPVDRHRRPMQLAIIRALDEEAAEIAKET